MSAIPSAMPVLVSSILVLGARPTFERASPIPSSQRHGSRLERLGTTSRSGPGCDAYDEAVQADPKSDEAFLGRAAVRLHLSQWDKAIKDFDEAIRLDPSA